MTCTPGGNDCTTRDLVRRRAALVLWVLPTVLVVIGACWPDGRAALWIPSLVVMGAACVVNAARCRRLHCHLTGPLFLLGALATALDALGVVAIDARWVLAALVVGTVAAFGLERVRGAYAA
jgi:hypothetical protein